MYKFPYTNHDLVDGCFEIAVSLGSRPLTIIDFAYKCGINVAVAIGCPYTAGIQWFRVQDIGGILDRHAWYLGFMITIDLHKITGEIPSQFQV